jgi:hypothetical protein
MAFWLKTVYHFQPNRLQQASAAFLPGDGDDEFQFDAFNDAPTEYEGERMLATANISGVAPVLTPKGSNTYSVSNASIGFGESGFGVFVESGGQDTYLCDLATCHGSAANHGLAIFHDRSGIEEIDTAEKDEVWTTDQAKIWRHGQVAVGVDE